MNKKLFSISTVLMILIGLAINVLLAQLATFFKVPLFLDSIGTIFCAAVGGFLPGIAVGFISNLINSISDPITRYYGILSILIAISTTLLSKNNFFKKWWGALIAALIFALIGGALGSLLTWMLYGFSFGSGISAPFAIILNEQIGFGKFWAQFVADVGIDVADKLISVVVVCLLLRFLPRKVFEKFPLGDIYQNRSGEVIFPTRESNAYKRLRKRSLRSNIMAIIVCTAIILSTLSMTIGTSIYQEKIKERYASISATAAELVTRVVDGDKVNTYLKEGEDDSYRAAENEMYYIMDIFKDIKYTYVYQIKEDGCHVVFDLDTPELIGGQLGDVVEFDSAFEPYLDNLLAGEVIPTVVSNDSYGWLLTVYEPIFDSEGICVAYAAIDVDMRDLQTDTYIFIIRLASLLFGAFMLIVAFALWYCDRQIITPINALVVQARDFDYKKNNYEQLKRTFGECGIRTGDELEVLYNAMCKSQAAIIGYVDEINTKSELITKMQRNIIYSFANMVENRDANTADHIRRTAAYVKVVGQSLLKDSKYSENLDENILGQMVESAPLHDIGKIVISDTILNKPGKLTQEEFEIMKTHTTAGKEILATALEGIEGNNYLSTAMEMANSHHERWDGNGYPEGLKGEDIPLSARIMAVADVFDALISKRSYKQALTVEQAYEIIIKESGAHFDPLVIKAFLAQKAKIAKIVEEGRFVD